MKLSNGISAKLLGIGQHPEDVEDRQEHEEKGEQQCKTIAMRSVSDQEHTIALDEREQIAAKTHSTFSAITLNYPVVHNRDHQAFGRADRASNGAAYCPKGNVRVTHQQRSEGHQTKNEVHIASYPRQLIVSLQQFHKAQ